MHILRNHHVLAVHDAKESARFYIDRLGFAQSHEDPWWTFVRRDGCTIMLGSCPDDAPASDLGSHSYVAYLLVDDVDGLYAEWRGRGVEPLDAPVDEAWGMREFGIRTPDGHRIRVGQRLEA